MEHLHTRITAQPSLTLPCWSILSGQQITYLLHLPSFPALFYYAIQKAAQPQASHFSEDRRTQTSPQGLTFVRVVTCLSE